MDAKKKHLQEKFEFHLKQAAGAAVELQVLEQGEGTPHYDQVELPAHAAGQEFSRLIQSERAREVAASQSPNTIERICWKVGNDLELAAEQDWQTVLTGEDEEHLARERWGSYPAVERSPTAPRSSPRRR